MSAGWPKRLTGIIALVIGVIADSILFASILKVSGSISTKTGLALSKDIVSAVDMNEKGVVIISSPGLILSAIIDKGKASVPEEQVMACFAPV